MTNRWFARMVGAGLLVGHLHLAACGERGPTVTPGDAGAVDTADVDASRGGDGDADDVDSSRVAECRPLDASGEDTISVERISGTAPASTGGVLADGVYHLTGVKMYTPPGEDAPPSTPMKAIVQVVGSSITIATNISGLRATRTMEVRIDGARLHVLSACDLGTSGDRSILTMQLDPIDFSSSTESLTITNAFDKRDAWLPDDYPDATVTHLTFTR